MRSLLKQAQTLFEQEGNLIQLRSGRVVFAGDTHGDIDATRRVIDRYLNTKDSVVFLGDYVDRGPSSVENVRLLLEHKLAYPHNLFLLMGNHEGFAARPFTPAEFWESLDPHTQKQYAETLSKLPLVVSIANGIIALHGALPEVDTLQSINDIEFGSREWRQITWGDWQEGNADTSDYERFTGRPRFDRIGFDRIMRKLGKNVLVRSHQPDIEPIVFDRKCLTIFTSAAYNIPGRKRVVAIADADTPIETVDDLEIEII